MLRWFSIKRFVIGSIVVVTGMLTLYAGWNAVAVWLTEPVSADVIDIELIEVERRSKDDRGVFNLHYRYRYDDYQSPDIHLEQETIYIPSPEHWAEEAKTSNSLTVYVRPWSPDKHYIEGTTSALGWLIATIVSAGLGALFSIVYSAIWGAGN